MDLNIHLDLTSEQVQNRLLEGLDIWIKLGLLSEAQMRELATALSEPVQLVPKVEESPGTDTGVTPITDFVMVSQLSHTQENASEPVLHQPSLLSRVVRSLLNEISIIWLLFLGVFLVVVSSGVLAASQWQSFSIVGQYAILLTYTLLFWGVSAWTQRQSHLQITARMLGLTTLLLIPVNFWMMDALGVLKSPLGMIFGGLSAIVLTGLPARLLTHRLNALNLMGLSWLHWGWGLGGWPLLATYLGTLGTAANLTYQDCQLARVEPGSTQAAQSDTPQPDTPRPDTLRRVSLDSLTVALSILILLTRSLLIAQVPPHQLGLAAGICGWLVVWVTRHQASRPIWHRVGLGLLFVGWILSVRYEPPWQAIGVSGLALWLLWERLRIHWRRDLLLALLGVTFQAYWLLWFMVPAGSRVSLLTGLSNRFATQPISGSEWASLGLLPFVMGVLLFAGQLRRRWRQPTLAQQTEIVALVLGGILALLSLGNSFSAVVNLSLSTATLAGVLRYRMQVPEALVELTHGVGLSALAAGIYYVAPSLSVMGWIYVGLGVAIAQLLVHLLLRSVPWRLSTWRMGLVIAAIDYSLLLLTWRDHPHWVWLMVPMTLTLVANHRRALQPKVAVAVTMVALMLQTPWLTNWPIAIASFAIGTLCMGLNSRIWRNHLVALFAVGSAIAWVTSGFGYGVIADGDQGRWLMLWTIEICVLWWLQRILSRYTARLAMLYGRAMQIWSIGLMVSLLLWVTLAAIVQAMGTQVIDASDFGVRFEDFMPCLNYALAAVLLLVIALAEAIYRRPAEWRFWSLAWAAELAVTIGLLRRGDEPAAIAIATIGLGLLAQIVADWWVIKRQSDYRISWHGIPIAYGVLGWLLGHLEFQAATGLYSFAMAVIFIGVGRRRTSLHPFSYLGLVVFSLGAYELLVYRLWQARGGQPGDGLTLLAGLALLIALVGRCLSPWLLHYLQIPLKGLRIVDHGHWAVGSLLAGMAALNRLSQPYGIAIWTGIALLLVSYALLIGNYRWTSQAVIFNHTTWTTLGLLEALLAVAYARFIGFSDKTALLAWGGVIACVMGLAFERAPWARWGWPEQPWRLMGGWLPMLALSITLDQVRTQGLLMVGAFYAWMGKQFEQIRLSYLSLWLLDWALLRYLNQQGWLTLLSCNLILGLSVLYVAEVEPYLQNASQKQQRHWLRTLASGLMGLTALYQAEVADAMLMVAGLTLLLSLGGILAGLILKVRAFLYVGTGTFVVQVIRVLWIFISIYPLLLWVIGSILGLLFIWMAARFESRRSHMTNLLAAWTSMLATWD